MLFGAHVSVAGGLENAPLNAHKIGCEVFQFFSRSPRGGPAPTLTKTIIKKFQENFKKAKQAECYIHTPYYINLASINNRIRYGSISVIREDLERGSLLGVKYVMSHLGSFKDYGKANGLKKVLESLTKILTTYRGQTQFLIEISAGSGEIIGDRFEEVAEIIKGLRGLGKYVGVCFDTCHAFASGYDLRNQKAVDKTLKDFNNIIGLNRLKLIHINDSKTDLNSKKDRHEHIGLGKIGLEGFKVLIHHPKLKKINMVLETPDDERGNYEMDLELLKKIRRH